MRKYRRHLLVVRPSLVISLDDLDVADPAEFQWLLHAKDRMDMDEGAQTVCSRREEARMHVHLATPGGLRFAQTDEWPVAPWAGFPTLNHPEPPRQWHFTATRRERAARRRIAAVMAVDAEAEVRAGPEADSVRVSARLDGAAVHFMIHLQPGATSAIEGELRPPAGPPDPIRVP